MKVSWNHFAVSHGKGAVDGIGGIVKEDEAWPSLLEDIDETTPQQYDVLASDTAVCSNSDDVEEGDWVVVIYDGWYPGVVE
ncbi:hypothetical protein J6590_057842 [Homalodisca vitripennis]|nr:hypothetical protein J6590_057842 [Homalodisca vitripennis]